MEDQKDCLIMYEDGELDIIVPDNRTDFTLEELYRLISCDTIEVFPLPFDKILILDENGKLIGNKLANLYASAIAGQTVVGDVILCDKSCLK